MRIDAYRGLVSVGEELESIEKRSKGRMVIVTEVRGHMVSVRYPEEASGHGWYPSLGNVYVGQVGVLIPTQGTRLYAPVGGGFREPFHFHNQTPASTTAVNTWAQQSSFPLPVEVGATYFIVGTATGVLGKSVNSGGLKARAGAGFTEDGLWGEWQLDAANLSISTRTQWTCGFGGVITFGNESQATVRSQYQGLTTAGTTTLYYTTITGWLERIG